MDSYPEVKIHPMRYHRRFHRRVLISKIEYVSAQIDLLMFRFFEGLVRIVSIDTLLSDHKQP
jgi:hypothetical protein